MATIVTRSGKGSALTFAEGDANFTNLNTDKIELSDISVTTGASAGTSALAYNNATGVLTFTPVEIDDLTALDDFSVTTAAAGTAALSYNNTTGVFTFTPEDTSDLAALDDFSVTTAAAGTAALSYNNATGVFTFTPEDTSDLTALDDFSVSTVAASGAGSLSYNNSTGVFTFAPVDTSLVLANVSEDSSPQLGADLDVNGNLIVSASNGNIEFEPNGSGNVNITTDTGGVNISTLLSYDEMIRSGRTGGTITVDHEQGPIEYIQMASNLTIQGFTTPTAGANVTLLLTNSASFTITFDETNSTFYAVDGVDPTLSGFDIINILCIDDTTDDEQYIITAVDSIQEIT